MGSGNPLMNLWRLRKQYNRAFYELGNLYVWTRFLSRGGRSAFGLAHNQDLQDKHNGRRAFVVGNGPSLNRQNITAIKNDVSFFVNRAFLHEKYEAIRPQYHVFIDPKLATGEWPLTFLDSVVEKNPDVTLLLNAEWYNFEKFQNYKQKFNIRWIYAKLFDVPSACRRFDLLRPVIGDNVVKAAVVAAIFMGIREIYLLGVDGNGLCYELMEQGESHFYGTNKENSAKSYDDICRDLDMMSTSLIGWQNISHGARRFGVDIRNATAGGIVDAFPRALFEDVVVKESA